MCPSKRPLRNTTQHSQQTDVCVPKLYWRAQVQEAIGYRPKSYTVRPLGSAYLSMYQRVYSSLYFCLSLLVSINTHTHTQQKVCSRFLSCSSTPVKRSMTLTTNFDKSTWHSAGFPTLQPSRRLLSAQYKCLYFSYVLSSCRSVHPVSSTPRITSMPRATTTSVASADCLQGSGEDNLSLISM